MSQSSNSNPLHGESNLRKLSLEELRELDKALEAEVADALIPSAGEIEQIHAAIGRGERPPENDRFSAAAPLFARRGEILTELNSRYFKRREQRRGLIVLVGLALIIGVFVVIEFARRH